MKVLFSLQDAGVGGGQTVALWIAEALVERGDAVGLLVPDDGPAVEAFASLGAPIHTHPLHRIREPKEVAGVTRDLRNYDLLYTHTAVGGQVLGDMAARAARRPHLIHQHTLPHLSSARAAGAGQRGLYRSLLRDRQYVAVAPHVRAGLLKLGVEPGHIEIVPNGVPIPEQVPPPHTGPVRVGILGRFDPGKGMLTFIEAAAMTGLGPDRATFVIGGSSGPFADHEAEVRTAAERVSVAIVEPGSDGVGFLAGLDVVVVPSRYEGSPLTLLEAMALGRAVVGSDIPGIRVHVGPDGALFAAPDHAEGFAERIRRLVEDAGLRRMMGQVARATAIQRFDVRTMRERVLAVIDDVAAARD